MSLREDQHVFIQNGVCLYSGRRLEDVPIAEFCCDQHMDQFHHHSIFTYGLRMYGGVIHFTPAGYIWME